MLTEPDNENEPNTANSTAGKKGSSKRAARAAKPDSEAVSLILKQAGKSDDEIAALASLDDADRQAENQFSGAAPTLLSLFGNVRAAELYAGNFNPAPEVAKVMSDSLAFLMKRKKEGTLCDHHRMLLRKEEKKDDEAFASFYSNRRRHREQRAS